MPALNCYLKKALIADVAVSGAAALAMIGGADLAAGLFGLPSALLFWSGVALIPFVAVLAMIIRAGAAPAGLVIAIIAVNLAWVAASLFLALGPLLAPTILGKVFVCTQAAIVLMLGELQINGLRQPRAMV